MRKTFKCLIAVIAALFIGVTANAQVTTSAMNGLVTDNNGEPLFGATVVATHTPSGTVYYAMVNDEGFYTIQGMRPGEGYEVEISYIGCTTVRYTDVTLKLGETYSQNAVLNSSEVLDAVVIVASTTKFTTEKTGATTNISNREMTSLPMVNRTIADITKYSPYADGMSIAGGDGRSTNFTVDGSNFNNNFGLSDKLPAGGSPISLEAIDEIQVVIAPFDVRQTNFIGGGVNAVTKSGNNTYKASAYSYFQNQNTRGNKINGIDLGNRAAESKTVLGFTLSGPIIKNKLFFFVNYEQEQRPGQVIKYRANKGGEAIGGNVSRTTIADLEAVKNYMMDTHGYDTGSYTDFFGDETNRKVLARLDWNIAKDHKLSLRYNYATNVYWTAPNNNSSDTGYRLYDTFRVGNYSMAFANNMYSQEQNVTSFALDYNAKLSDNISNQFLATYTMIDDARGSNSDPFPHIDIIKQDENGVWQPYMSLGYELFTWNNGVHNNTLAIKDDLTMLFGSHKITAGISYEHQICNNAYMRNGTNYYRYAWTDEANIIDVLKGTPESFAITYGWNGEKNPNAQVTFNQIGVYAQDEWNVTDKFKLTYGVRLDNLIFDNSDIATNNAILNYTFRDGVKIDTGKWPKSRVQVSPRVGFVWDVKGDNTLKVRGGTGLFQGRLPLVYFTNMPSNAGMVQNSVQFKSNWENGVLLSKNEKLHVFDNGNIITSVDDAITKLGLQKEISDDKHVAGSTMSGVDPNFKMPQVWKTSLAVDYMVPTDFPFNVTVEGVYNKTIYGVVVDNINITNDVSEWQRFKGPDNRLIYPANKGYIHAGKNAPYLTNTNKGYGYTGNIIVNMEPVKNLKLMASYTHTESKEITGLPGSDPLSTWQGAITVDGPNFSGLHRSDYVTPHKVIGSINYELPVNLFGGLSDLMQFSLFYTGFSPYGNSYCISNDMNGDNIKNDLMYIYPKGSDINWVGDASAQAAAYDAFVAQDRYLRTHKGQYAEAYAASSPWVNRIDFRMAQNFKFNTGNQKHNIQLSLDILNLGNLFNSKWGVYKTNACSNNNRILNYEGINAAGEPTYSFNKFDNKYISQSYDYTMNSNQCWQIQFGIKYIFN